jgi:hypothetical protein
VAVNFDDSGVDHGVFHVWLVRAGVEKAFENIGAHPISEADEDGVPLAKQWRQVTPRAACPGNPQHRLYEQTIVCPATPSVGDLAKAMRFHLRPLGVA